VSKSVFVERVMSKQWTECEGHTIDGKFFLHKYLAGTDHSVVFLTTLPEVQTRKAVIKFIATDPSAADAQLAIWKRASQLSHLNLLGIHASGRCRIADMDLLYVVMDYVEENLAEILPQRPLTLEETRQMLDPVLDVLIYLHGKGFVHGHLKPSNVLATEDRLKLSSDTIVPVSQPRLIRRDSDIYDSPEAQSSALSPKSDVWSLGITLVEALTQRPPALPTEQSADTLIPAELPQPFHEFAQSSLHRDPDRRASVAEIAARLHPAPLAAAAVAASASFAAPPQMSPLHVPLSSEPAVPLAKLPAIKHSPVPGYPDRPAQRELVLPNFAIPLVLGAAVLLGLIFAAPKLFKYHPAPASTPAPAKLGETPVATPSVPAAATAPEKIGASEPPRPLPVRPADQLVSNPASAFTKKEPPTVPTAKAVRQVEGQNDVLNEVLPQASSKALATIQGTIRVGVKVHVDAAGNVTEADFDNPGPSKYFANLAEQAARKWQFSGAEAGGHAVPSEWLIRFEFSPEGVHAFPQQTAPQ
jgi:TonB family protein